MTIQNMTTSQEYKEIVGEVVRTMPPESTIDELAHEVVRRMSKLLREERADKALLSQARVDIGTELKKSKAVAETILSGQLAIDGLDHLPGHIHYPIDGVEVWTRLFDATPEQAELYLEALNVNIVRAVASRDEYLLFLQEVVRPLALSHKGKNVGELIVIYNETP